MHEGQLVYWSARASGVAYFVAVVLAGRRGRGGRSDVAVRTAWTVACGLLVAHEILAIALSFGWSQSLAWRRIAEQTLDVTGVDFGGGLVVNYVTAIVWTADVAWWWIGPASHAARPRWIDVSLWTLLAAMFFFGAVVFADGWTRTAAAAMFAVAGIWLVACARQRPERTIGCSAST
ncbi:MAG: hypothetical protein WD875_17105 [Pirellulales bacterium]